MPARRSRAGSAAISLPDAGRNLSPVPGHGVRVPYPDYKALLFLMEREFLKHQDNYKSQRA
jgi:hypothetical protein